MRSRVRWFATAKVLGAVLGTLVVAAPVHAQHLTVFAAASVKEALDEVGRQFQRATGHNFVVSYAASSALAKQIENGAPADVFISADLDWMNYLGQRKLINVATRTNLLRNRLVLIAPSDSAIQAQITPRFPLAALLGSKGRLSMADPDSVPAGKYTKAALEKLGVWSSVESRVARGDNVRTALNFVARGEAPLGIVYQTDAYAESRVRIVALFPHDTHPPIIYPVAVTAASKHASTPSFVSFLKSKEARTVFEKHGFSVDQ